MNLGPIVIIEDDADDCEMITGALTAIGIQNEFRCFDTPVLALRYLKTTHEQPFLIISDINMPFMNGIEFRKKLVEDPDYIKSRMIPFVFLTTSKNPTMVAEAFSLFIQGFFVKPVSQQSLKMLAKSIIDYWQQSLLPQTRMDN